MALLEKECKKRSVLSSNNYSYLAMQQQCNFIITNRNGSNIREEISIVMIIFQPAYKNSLLLKIAKLKDVLEYTRNIGENDKLTMDWKLGNLEQYQIR